MTPTPGGTGHAEPNSAAAGNALDPTPGQMLLEQYKLLEERRKYFGSQFMQTIGGLVAIVSLAITLLGGKPENKPMLKYALTFGGSSFLLLALLAHRLAKRQDDCEREICEAESLLQSMGYKNIVRMQPGAKHGARLAIVAFVAIVGAILFAIGVSQIVSTGW